MTFKLAFRRRACCLVVLGALLVIVLRLYLRTGSTDNWVTYDQVRTGGRGTTDLAGAAGGPKTILLWTPFFGEPDYVKPMDQLGCPDLRCQVTSNRSNLDRADAVIFHARDTRLDDLPTRRTPSQRWVLLHHESPHNTPDFFSALNGKINWTITYRLDSDVILSPVVRRKSVAVLPEVGGVKSPANPGEGGATKATADVAASKTRMVVWFVSNCHTSSNREAYVKELQKTVHVDIVGSCGDRECNPKMSDKCYQDAAKEYRFYLSFENSICRDYVTEKFFHVLNYDMVPVVFGGADYSQMAPPDSYVDALTFDSPRALGKHLLELAKDPDRYNRFFRWKRDYEMFAEHYACTLCRKMHDPSEPAKVWKNLQGWWFKEANCRTWKNLGSKALVPA